MNVLPTGPDQIAKPKNLERYFSDLKRWNYDVAYNAFYAFPWAKLIGEYRTPYIRFAARAHRAPMRACVQIQSTVANSADVSTREGQFYHDNSCWCYEHFVGQGKTFFFGSFASRVWLNFLKKVTRQFRHYGYDWVVFEEPMFRADIPGTKDRFYARFKREFPNLAYPTRQDDTPAYAALQRLKRRVLIEFFDALTRFAKRIGFEKVGIMPWFFTPTFENTPIETWNSCCDIGSITFLPALDFIVVRMQPDNIYAEAMTAAGGESLPRLGYLEVLAHNIGKPIIAVNNPTNEHMPHGYTGKAAFRYDYFARYTLAAAAAAPSGMTRHWYTKDYGLDAQHMRLLSSLHPYLNRLGRAISPIAFVFSYEGIARLLPRAWKDSWRHYWNFARTFLYEEKIPFLTFYAEHLEECLARHPEVRLIVLSEYFPIPQKEIKFLKRWVEADARRRILYLGCRNGYCFDPVSLYNNFDPRPPEMLELFGVDTAVPIEIFADDDYVRLNFSGRDRREHFLKGSTEFSCCGYGVPKFRPIKRLDVLYTSASKRKLERSGNPESSGPIIVKLATPRGGFLLYVGLSLDGSANELPLPHILEYLLRDADYPVQHASRGILWNRTSTNYLIVSNIYEERGTYEIAPADARLWDARKKKLLHPPLRLSIHPLSFHVYRMIPKNSPLLDFTGFIYVTSLEESPRRITINGFSSPQISLHTLKQPKKCVVNAREAEFSCLTRGSLVNVAIPATPGDVALAVHF
jgi:hypothetical protein